MLIHLFVEDGLRVNHESVTAVDSGVAHFVRARPASLSLSQLATADIHAARSPSSGS